MKWRLTHTCWWYRTFCYTILLLQTKITMNIKKTHITCNHRLIPYWLYFIALWCFLKFLIHLSFDHRECSWYSKFFLNISFHINDIDHNFSAFSFGTAHYNCVLMNSTDIICICPDLFSCSCQYTPQNVPKSSNRIRMKHINSTNNHDNCQHKQEYCIWKTVHITNHSKNENHDEYHNYYWRCSII